MSNQIQEESLTTDSLPENPMINNELITPTRRLKESLNNIHNNIRKSSQDNFFTELAEKLDKQMDNIFDTFVNKEIPLEIQREISSENSSQNNLDSISRNKLTVFKTQLGLLKSDLLKNFVVLLELENKITSKVVKRKKFITKLNCLQDLDDLVDGKYSVELRKIITDISKDIDNSTSLKNDINQYLDLYRQHANYLENLSSINCLNNKPLCPLCLTNSISTTLTPCGHTFCEHCAHKLTKCGVCRQEIQNKQKIYII